MMIMTYYEIKKVFSKKGSKVTLIFIFIVISVVLSFIIGDNKYVNRNGDAESGISAMLKVRELKKEWSGELTEDVLRKIIEENVRISQTPEAKSNDFRQNDSRGDLVVLDAIHDAHFETEAGPGVYDIHSPRIPSEKEIEDRIYEILDKMDVKKVWINPDCGLKTRGNAETWPSLENLVAAAKAVRAKLDK